MSDRKDSENGVGRVEMVEKTGTDSPTQMRDAASALSADPEERVTAKAWLCIVVSLLL